MMNINDLDVDHLVGAVCHKDAWHLFAGSVAEWMMDYVSYDPASIERPHMKDFRGGLAIVDRNVADKFINAMHPWELNPKDLYKLSLERDEPPLRVVMNFDKRLFVDGFCEYLVPFTDHVPRGWTAIEDDPVQYLPEYLQKIWKH